MNESKLKVLFIAGWGRSGSTILANILGQIEGVSSIGEINYLWDRGLLENRNCGCGKPFLSCENWKNILGSAYSDPHQLDPQQAIESRDRFRSRHTLISKLPSGAKYVDSQIKGYKEHLEKLLHGVQEADNCRVIVDSSKFPSHGYILSRMTSIDLYIVHLVRDSRAVAFSWKKKKMADPHHNRTLFIQRKSTVRSAWLWMSWNLMIELLWKKSNFRYQRLRYEDFISNPKESLEKILQFIEEPTDKIPIDSKHQASLEVCHTISGNPSRFSTGTVKLKIDEQWKSDMKKSDRRTLSLLTWPLLWRYGYAPKR